MTAVARIFLSTEVPPMMPPSPPPAPGSYTVMVASEGSTAYYSPSASATMDVTPNELFAVTVEILRNDLGSASERVTAIRIDGVKIGDCNPDGGDYDCTFFDW